MYNEIKPYSSVDWGNLNNNFINSYSDTIILNLSYFTNTIDYYEILIPNTVNYFTVIGNINITFNASIKAEPFRINPLTVTIQNLNLSEKENTPVIDISRDNKDNKLIFEGINKIKNLSTSENSNNTAISILSDTQLSISGSYGFTNNLLEVLGGVYSAAIGSYNSVNTGTIIIYGNNTKITALGGYGSPGIGGGLSADGGSLTISHSSIVTSRGGYYGGGIGGGFGYNVPGNSGDITICDLATVYAYGGVGGVGIGGGSCFYDSGGDANNVIIKDSATVYADGDYCGAGIGGGFGLGGTGGSLKNLVISNFATTYAYGGGLSAGIGGGYGGYGGRIRSINISDSSKVYAYGGEVGGGISGGTSGNLYSLGGHGGEITISGNSLVVANAGKDGAGIGGGAGGIGGNGELITVTDYAEININTFLGYYKNNTLAVLNLCGGSINVQTLYLSDINLCGGVAIVNDPNFTPLPESEDYFLSVKLIHPNNNPYTSPVYLRKTNDNSYKYYVTPNNNGEITFYASGGSYFFESSPLPSLYQTKTFTSPYKYGNQIILVIPAVKASRGINLFS